MKSHPVSTPLALWLDPETTLGAEHNQALHATGWAVMAIHTLDELLAHATDASLVVLRLTSDVSRLKAVQQLLQQVWEELQQDKFSEVSVLLNLL